MATQITTAQAKSFFQMTDYSRSELVEVMSFALEKIMPLSIGGADFSKFAKLISDIDEASAEDVEALKRYYENGRKALSQISLSDANVYHRFVTEIKDALAEQEGESIDQEALVQSIQELVRENPEYARIAKMLDAA